ncbi:hypothetical protein RhiirC2_718001 [Rhizophagus irregularis]|uniref:Uncharacterized protein n=1 Tax=Rhizophagus irregularis TaxID=588596 RepID=A0A2N1MK71_9GLOM|nr:hypothetical protein RhiirC2_718001 [Rhizophagus irregularis]
MEILDDDILPTNSDSSIDNESIKEVEIAYFTKNLGVSTIIYLTVPMECPATSPDGVATVFSIQGWKNHMNTFNDIQYSIGSGGIQECPFLATFLLQNIRKKMQTNVLLLFQKVLELKNVCYARTPDNIKDNLQMMIKEAIEKDDVVKSGSIIQGNMLKAYFNKETLQEIHMSLNNIDKLRYLVAKTYKNLYPFKQHILGVFQSVYGKQIDLHNYVIKLMISLLKAESKVELNQIFSDIEKYDEKWRERGQKLDERHLKIIEIQDFSAIPYTKQDKSQVKRQLLAINRKEKRNQKNKEDNNSLKRKYGQSKIQPIDENNYEFESDNSRSFRA